MAVEPLGSTPSRTEANKQICTPRQSATLISFKDLVDKSDEEKLRFLRRYLEILLVKEELRRGLVYALGNDIDLADFLDMLGCKIQPSEEGGLLALDEIDEVKRRIGMLVDHIDYKIRNPR